MLHKRLPLVTALLRYTFPLKGSSRPASRRHLPGQIQNASLHERVERHLKPPRKRAGSWAALWVTSAVLGGHTGTPTSAHVTHGSGPPLFFLGVGQKP